MITLGNRGDDGEVDPVWDFLFKATRFLRCEGMSSDESGQEGLGPPYYVRIREWRSREGNIRPGNSARERTRLAAAPVSMRKAIPELPLNFYDKTWYADLNCRDKALLKAGPVLDLPVLIA